MPILWKPFWSDKGSEVEEEPQTEIAKETSAQAEAVTETPKPEPEPIAIGTPSVSSQAFSEASIANMSFQDINDNWDTICKGLESA